LQFQREILHVHVTILATLKSEVVFKNLQIRRSYCYFISHWNSNWLPRKQQ